MGGVEKGLTRGVTARFFGGFWWSTAKQFALALLPLLNPLIVEIRKDEGGVVVTNRMRQAILVAVCLFLIEFPVLASPTIRFENELIQGVIGKEVSSDVVPGLPEGARQHRISSGCMSRGLMGCEMGMKEISFVMPGPPLMRIRAVFLERNTGKRVMLPKKIGWPGMVDSVVWQIVDGFAFHDEQKPRGLINKRKPYLEMSACELPDQRDENIVAIGKVVNPVNGNFFITHLKPIYHAWRVDQAKQRFVEISPKGIECITDSEGSD